MERTVTAVGVLDKAFTLLELVRDRPRTLRELVDASALSKATAHRLATSLEDHGMLRRDSDGRYHLGLGSLAYAAAARASLPLEQAARAALTNLRDSTGESSQLYVRRGRERVCVLSLESAHGLRTIVRAGETLPHEVGSGGRALTDARVIGAGWVASVAEREPGVASVSAPVFGDDGHVAGAVGISGPIERLGQLPGDRYGDAVVAAARAVEAASGFEPAAPADPQP